MQPWKIRSLLIHGRQVANIANFKDLQTKYLADHFIKGCEDCRTTYEVRPLGPIVHDPVWKKIARGDWKVLLCQQCMEWRLNRKLVKADMPVIPWNIIRGNVKLEDAKGEPVANRNMQAKRRKLSKQERALPRALSAEAVKVTRYNNTSQFAMKERKFLPPDAQDRNSPAGLEFGPIPETINPVFNNFALAEVHADLDRRKTLEQIALKNWASWNRKGTAVYTKVRVIHMPNIMLINAYLSGDDVRLVKEDYKRETISLSNRFKSLDDAKVALNIRTVQWAEVKPLVRGQVA